MTDSTAAALLATILADPVDDAVRLVYADWLDDHGSPERAEFIRVQVRIAQLDAELMADEDCNEPTCACAERRSSRNRSQNLLDSYALGWLGPAAGDMIEAWEGYAEMVLLDRKNQDASWPVSASWHRVATRIIWRRGFVDEVRCTCAVWLAHGDAIVAAHPVTRVRLTTDAVTILTHWIYCDYRTVVWCGEAKRLDLRNDLGLDVYQPPDAISQALFRHRWPRITFTFPEA